MSDEPEIPEIMDIRGAPLGFFHTEVLERSFLITALPLVLLCLTLAPRAPQLRMSKLPDFDGCSLWQMLRICVP